eukprot:scaffold7619_cov87-Skeletonema_dohrnii-CCMP3373.AAC.2
MSSFDMSLVRFSRFHFSSTRLTASALKRRSRYNNQELVIPAQSDPGSVQNKSFCQGRAEVALL